jgi:hypothetical protein
LAIARRIGDTTALDYCLVGLAGALTLAVESAAAARLFGAAEALRERSGNAIEIGARRALYEQHVALARASLGAEALAAAWAAGRALTPDEAIAEALEETA